MTKISQLSSIGDSLAIDDQFLIRDVSDGTTPNKSVTVSGITRALADGSETAPALAFASDKDTGIYRTGANALAISTNGTGRLFVASDGKVGVGTSSPGRIFQIDSGAVNNSYARFTNANSTDSGVEIGLFDNGSSAGQLILSNTMPDGVIVFNTNSTERLRITSDGKLGLGTSNPAPAIGNGATLHLYGASTTSELRLQRGDGTDLSLLAGSTSGGGTIALNRNFSISTDSNATRAFTVDTSGRVGIGTTGPAELLHLQSGSNTTLRIDNTGGTSRQGRITVTSAGDMEFRARSNTSDGQFIFYGYGGTTDSERARIDSSGRLLVGTSSGHNVGGTLGNAQFSGAGAQVHFVSTSTSPSYINLAAGSSGTDVTSATVLGRIQFFGYHTNGYDTGARIEVAVDGTPGDGDLPTRLVFSTTADGASSPTEQMRIGSAGDVLIGVQTLINQATSSGDGTRITTNGQQFLIADGAPALFIGRNSSDGESVDFRRGGVKVGSISVTASATAYNTSSDYRLKKNVVPLTGAADRLNQLQVHRFNFIADPDKTVDGFIAHEAQAVVPECVTGTKDEVDDEGNPVYQGIDQSKLVPLLTAALQEALAEIESLKARVTALEP